MFTSLNENLNSNIIGYEVIINKLTADFIFCFGSRRKTDFNFFKTHIAESFKQLQPAFMALGDETRQQIIMTLLTSDHNGIRVGEITSKTHLSRPAVSHHLKTLRDAGIVNMRREGTMNYYYVDADESQWKQMMELAEYVYEVARDISENGSCRKKEE